MCCNIKYNKYYNKSNRFLANNFFFWNNSISNKYLIKFQTVFGLITSSPSMVKYMNWELEDPNKTKLGFFMAAGIYLIIFIVSIVYKMF